MTNTRKQRGSRTVGRGRGRSHNYGSGNRGGFGRAGSGKKGDAKKPSYWQKSFGKKAFGMHARSDVTTLNVSDIQHRVESLVAAGKVKADSVTLDLTKLGYEKLLGSGAISASVTVTIDSASERAIAKIESAGGKVVLPNAE